ncbi:hypothetical protein AAZX31_20G153300 [Glycine max]
MYLKLNSRVVNSTLLQLQFLFLTSHISTKIQMSNPRKTDFYYFPPMDPDFAGAPPDTAFHQIKEKRRHRNSYTVAACGPVVSRGKRAMDSEELAELARVDPKRVNRWC